MKHLCNCGGEDVNVMSVEEGVTMVDNSQIATVDITFVCNKCGNTEIEKHYLYKLKKVVVRAKF